MSELDEEALELLGYVRLARVREVLAPYYRGKAAETAVLAQVAGAERVGLWLRSRARELPDGGSMTKAELLDLATTVVENPEAFLGDAERCPGT